MRRIGLGGPEIEAPRTTGAMAGSYQSLPNSSPPPPPPPTHPRPPIKPDSLFTNAASRSVGRPTHSASKNESDLWMEAVAHVERGWLGPPPRWSPTLAAYLAHQMTL